MDLCDEEYLSDCPHWFYSVICSCTLLSCVKLVHLVLVFGKCIKIGNAVLASCLICNFYGNILVVSMT